MVFAPLLSDGMILQRDEELKISGVSSPNAKISCCLRLRSEYYANEESCIEKSSTEGLSIINRCDTHKEYYNAEADINGEWSITISPHPAGGPYDIALNNSSEEVIHDILFGDVWLLAGQSNMELPISRTLDLYADEAAMINDPDIRIFEVPKEYDFNGTREELSGGRWIPAVKEHIMGFSALGYFFAKELKEKYKIPIGLIQTAVGGTPIEAWIPEKSLRKIGGYDNDLDACKNETYVREVNDKFINEMNVWMNKVDASEIKDEPAAWKKVTVPGLWNNITDNEATYELNGINGCIWLKKNINISDEIYNKALEDGTQAKAILGAMIDSDEVYINDIKIGSTGYRYPPRKYVFPARILKRGMNEIKIRIIVQHGDGGFIPDKRYQLLLGGHVEELSGEWEYQITKAIEEAPQQTFFQYKPSGCFNAMIYPIRNYKISGICFYQGESNTERSKGYRKLFNILINNWRILFKQEELPFLYVQLANFSNSVKNSSGIGWAKLREEQRHGLAIPNTAMVVTIDTGEYNDLHPQNKKTVAKRLALCARKLKYREDIIISGPVYSHQTCLKDKIIIHFTSIGDGLIAHGEVLNGFEICGEDEVYMPAKAVIEGDTVVVFSPMEIKMPYYVRYAWLDNPETANLYNKKELPASPFITKSSY